MGGEMRLAAVAVASLVASGCVATRYSPQLDRELTDAGKRFLESTSVVVSQEGQPGNILDTSIAHPGWELGSGPAPSVRAFNSAVNELAAKADTPVGRPESQRWKH
jgi:hypothetical protein